MAGGRGGRLRGGSSQSSRSSRASLSSSHEDVVPTDTENEEVMIDEEGECSQPQQQQTLHPDGIW